MITDKFSLKQQLIIATVITIGGLLTLIAGFIVPPLGIIHSSVLIAYGESLTFVGSILGVDYHYRIKERLTVHGNK